MKIQLNCIANCAKEKKEKQNRGMIQQLWKKNKRFPSTTEWETFFELNCEIYIKYESTHTHTKMKTNEISNKYYAKKEQAKTQNQNEKKKPKTMKTL